MSTKKLVHWHGCRRCRIPYEDTCMTRKTNELCSACSGGIPFQLLVDNAKPRRCCATTTRLATKDEQSRYGLAGEASWWICQQCKRTQIYKPNANDVFKENR